MKPKILKLSTVLLLFLFIGASCAKDELPPLEDKQLTIVETNAQGCKDNLKSTEVEQYIELKAEGENKLRLKFTNAKINCAGLDTTYAVINNEILKVSFVDYTIANCICEYDLECVIDSMENRSYEIEVFTGSNIPEVKFSFNYSKDLNTKYNVNND